jgi:hypothetical protein
VLTGRPVWDWLPGGSLRGLSHSPLSSCFLLPGFTWRNLGIIERNARTQAKLIEDVLDVSRIVSGKLALNLGPTNVADAVRTAIETVTPAADAKEIVIDARLTDASLTITADADRMQQVVWNLLANAVKFTPKSGTIAVRAFREGSEIHHIIVSDTGEGIPPSVLPLIFEPFQQADASTTRRHGGLGLGLAIVKELVSAHGGSVTATSDGRGQGATFVVRLPARAAGPAVRALQAAPPATGIDPAVDRGPRMDRLRLLVVDDEQDALGAGEPSAARTRRGRARRELGRGGAREVRRGETRRARE